MTKRIRNLRHPIFIDIGGQRIEMLTIGYLARAVGRTPGTIKYWTQLGLFPSAPFALFPNTPNVRRRLYPAAFVSAMKVIADRGNLGSRLEREDWRRFKRDVDAAFEKTVAPLLGQLAPEPRLGNPRRYTTNTRTLAAGP